MIATVVSSLRFFHGQKRQIRGQWFDTCWILIKNRQLNEHCDDFDGHSHRLCAKYRLKRVINNFQMERVFFVQRNVILTTRVYIHNLDFFFIVYIRKITNYDTGFMASHIKILNSSLNEYRLTSKSFRIKLYLSMNFMWATWPYILIRDFETRLVTKSTHIHTKHQ